MMNPSDWILLATLFVVILYTRATYAILKEQRKQFELANRPWVCASDVTYKARLVVPDLGIVFYNFGKLPAKCKILVKRLHVKPEFGEEEVALTQEGKAVDLVIFPHVEGADSQYQFLFDLTEEQSKFISRNCRIRVELRVDYQALSEVRRREPYTYEATLLVERFEEKSERQLTLINDARST